MHKILFFFILPFLSFGQSPVFTAISSEQSGITFSNTLEHNVETKENLFDFDYFYNGAGVGVGDFNNDGLADIFFAGNQVEDRLYMNQGKLRFKDISESAGINLHKTWSNGVSIVDINQDGYDDIYITEGGPYDPEKRRNRLYINNGDLTFREEAKKYGLADEGISTQAAFFDFDKDGDYDCFVANENDYYGLGPIDFFNFVGTNDTVFYQNSSHFYENVNGHFEDRSKEFGMLFPSFSLGLCVSDVNGDSWPDIYVANDYYVPDQLWINQEGKGFVNQSKESTLQQSFYGMGVDIADINQDGKQDIYVLDMASADHYRSKTLMASMDVDQFFLLTKTLGFPYQYMFNSLNVQVDSSTYGNQAQKLHLAKTDWSWSGMMSDFNLDGLPEIYVSNGYRRYGSDNDFRNLVLQTQIAYQGQVPNAVKDSVYQLMPSEKLSNILFHRNSVKSPFSQLQKEWGLDIPSFSNGAVHADLDNDGDLDIVVNNIDQEAFLFRNNTVENKDGRYLKFSVSNEISDDFAKIYLYHDGQTQMKEIKTIRGYRSSQPKDIIFGVGTQKKIDSVRVEYIDGSSYLLEKVKTNQTIDLGEKSAKKVILQAQNNAYFRQDSLEGFTYQHVENDYTDFIDEVLLPYRQSTLGPSICVGDIDGDGKEDLLVGGGAGQPTSVFLKRDEQYKKVNIGALSADRIYEDGTILLFDADGDEDKDIFITSMGNVPINEHANYENRFYINGGNGKFVRDTNFVSKGYSTKSAVTIDIDKDGDLDLLISKRLLPGHYPEHGPVELWINQGGTWEQSVPGPELKDWGMVNDMEVIDIDGDGWQDLIAVGEWTGIGVFRNDKGVLKMANPDMADSKGWWFSIIPTDVNQDGQMDFIIGNLGLNSKYKASNKKPLKVYANDFDQNGSLDIVLNSYYQDKEVPLRGKECSTQQMPFVSEKFETYDAFASASLEEIYEDGLKTATEKEVNTFASVVLINRGDFHFDSQNLPAGAQNFPILDGLELDVDGDGKMDVLPVGNIYGTEPETPRLDYPNGIVLHNTGKDSYRVMSHSHTGIVAVGNVKSVSQLTTQNSDYLIFLRSDDKPLIYKKK